ncbi:hypothetical protein QJS10_CPB04g00726 [Acorus calamus]|uniref:Uncharacterized protein n=1 Tax=Acorus calamus TaxID=4465 RepID=A0AAV9F259_ACOCL|nr:hypothetical protein QJS10_CPB04g00726 [Acorus calamus]
MENGEVIGSPQMIEKSIHKTSLHSLPRFMTSTACSRQRQNVAVEDISRVRTPRPVDRRLVELCESQSLSNDTSFKSNSHPSKSKSAVHDVNKVKAHSSKGLDLKRPPPTPRDRRVIIYRD